MILHMVAWLEYTDLYLCVCVYLYVYVYICIGTIDVHILLLLPNSTVLQF